MEAYVTLVATDSYAAGALVLAHRLRDLGSSKEIVCLVTPTISSQVQKILSNICTLVQVDTLRSSDHKNLQLLGRPELDITFTKIQLWKLTQYKKIVFLDADTYPIQNIDQLFERPSFSAAPDAGWPDCFNSGVFVTEPSDTVYNGLCQLANDKGSFDGGDQGLLNSFFSTWPTSPEHRLPFTFNTTPTSQYGYAPAQNEFGQNISIVHFIGENKPWKYQRFADGRVLPLGSTWEGTKHMIQAWWNTWDTYYGQTSPYHLLSGEFDDTFDDGFQTRPIVPFDENVKNAWDDQPVDWDHHRRQIQPMPPISSITIGQPDWLIQEAERRRQLEEQEQTRRREEEEQARHEAEEQRRHQEENRRREEEERSREELETRNHEYHHDHHHEEHYHHDHHHDNYQGGDDSHVQQHHKDQQHHHHYEEHHHHQEHQAPKEYSMIEWDPAHQEPPNTGSLGADIPDLSSFRNVWDQPRNEQPSRWVAPLHLPEPQIMTKPEYAHYNAHDYAPDAYYAPIHHEFNPPPAPAEPEPEPVVHHHYHYEEPQYPPSFPWDNKPEHFPPPTRVWQDEQPPPQPEEPVYHHQPEEPNHHQDHDNHVHEDHPHQEQRHEEHHEVPPEPQHEQHNLSIVIDHHDKQDTEHAVQQASETHHHARAQEEEKMPSPVIEQPQQQQDEELWEENEQPTFAIDAMMSPSAQSKIDEFIASLNEGEDEEISDRDLIPIKFKPTSRLSGMYTPSPSGSRVNSRAGSRSNSRSGSRRASVSNSRRNSVIVINKPSPSLTQPQQSLPGSIIAAPTFTIPDDNDTTAQQSQKLFAASSAMFSRKTPYTSAAVTPAMGLTPDEFGADGYFDDPEEEEGREQEDFTFKPDFLNEAQYSLNESLVESTTSEEWDPLNALNKLKEHSESMVLRQSLQEALVKTAKEQQEKEEAELAATTATADELVPMATTTTATITEAPASSEFIPINKTPSKKKKYAFKSTWDDEEYDLPSALVSGESSPRTPIARSMSSSDLTKEIEMEKERYKQQRASLMLAQPQAAVASMLEAELDLSRGTLFKRRYYDASNDHQANAIQSAERITQETSELIESESDDEEDATDFIAYYDDYVIQEAQKRLRALVTGEEVDTSTEMPEPIGGPKHNNSDNMKSKRPSHMYQYGEAKEPQPLSLLWNSQSYTSNFGFDAKHKLPIYQSDLIPTEDVAEEIKSLSAEIVVKEDPYTKRHRLAKEEEERKLKAEQEKLEEERLSKEKMEEEENAKANIDDANLTLDEIKIDSVLCKSDNPPKKESKSEDSSSVITTTIVTTPTKDLEDTVKSNKSKATESTLTTNALEIPDVSANTGIISPESPIPIQTVNEKQPTLTHQASSSLSTSSISSSATTSRHSFTSYTATSTKEASQTTTKKSNASSLSNRTSKK